MAVERFLDTHPCVSYVHFVRCFFYLDYKNRNRIYYVTMLNYFIIITVEDYRAPLVG